MSDIKNPLPSAFTPPHVLSGLDKSESILVGFSGGADSTALLHMLSEYAKDSGAKIYAAHVNHGIRGEEADRDESFCQSFAKNLGKVAPKIIITAVTAPVVTMARRISDIYCPDTATATTAPMGTTTRL